MKKRLLSSPKLFTPELATKTLPLVSAILAELAPLYNSVRGTRRRVEHLIESRGIEQGNPYSDELSSIEENLARDIMQVESLINELREIGIEFKGSSQGCHACYPTMLDGRLVYLSWLLGEPEVSHWVDLDGDFEDRQSLFLAAVD